MERYWVYIDTKIQGPVDIPSLRKLQGFNLLTQVCREGEQSWRVADEVIEIKSYFLAPPRVSSLPINGNLAVAPLEQPFVETMDIPEPIDGAQVEKLPAEIEVLEEPPVAKSVAKAPPTAKPAGGNSLRISCVACAYKNPRDVAVCMKCGTPIPSAGEETLPDEPAEVKAPAPATVSIPVPAPIKEELKPVDDKAAAPANGMVEVPVTKILLISVLCAVVAGAGFGGYRMFMSKKHPHTKAKAIVPKESAEGSEAPAPKKSHSKKSSTSSSKPVARHKAAALPGVTAAAGEKVKPAAAAEKHSHTEAAEPPASYRVIEDAAPLRHRTSSPSESVYARKNRANKALWTEQEQKALQQVQRYRIYGAQRTIGRNAEILMQILRDREYNEAFENGKRLRLYNDMDWSASQRDGPLYDIRLTFSGGRDADGAPKKPLKFAFYADIERETVEPGGDDQVRANTLHAFFDESRIPPEERRAIAKDTEELVLAGQPDASPLALDTVARHFVATYSPGALTRVANAFGLSTLEKKAEHDPRLTSTGAKPKKPFNVDDLPLVPGMGASNKNVKVSNGSSSSTPSAIVVPQSKKYAASKSGDLTFQMEKGMGRDRSVTVVAPSKAGAGRLWETLTGYDRLKQFTPDLLVSEKEGQDGSAIIVHTVFLTRFAFFVFKTNLHLRVIERPAEKTIEFERIAGEFQSFRGSAQIVTDPGTNLSTLTFKATVVPSGRMPDWVLRGVAQRFLVPVVEAIRAHAESN